MTTENPYAAPKMRNPDWAVPAEVLDKIRLGWAAALFSAGMTLVVTIAAMTGTESEIFSAWSLLDVAMILGLAFGIYKKSRVCAVLMLVYFVASKVFIVSQTGSFSSIPVGLIFTYLYLQAVLGTFTYHKIVEANLAKLAMPPP
jgi:hypothetical protein